VTERIARNSRRGGRPRSLEGTLSEELGRIRRADRWRFFRTLTGPQGEYVRVRDGANGAERELLMLASNNYLGLAHHPQVREAVAAAALDEGAGAGASRHVSGSMRLHEALERRLAAFVGKEAAVLFGSGYLANVGILSALLGPGDAVFSDELNHASIIDGCRLSGAKKEIYRHADVDDLSRRLARSRARRKLVVSEAVFSMGGDLAPLQGIIEAAERYEAWTMVDEAHALGVFGHSGRGLVDHFALTGRVDVLMGTLGKALGGCGAFAAGSRKLIDFLINRCRTLLFTTALPPGVCAGVMAALDLIDAEPERIQRLHARAERLRSALSAAGLDLFGSSSPILPIRIGGDAEAVAVADTLWRDGLFIVAIRPPTVPPATSRIRVTVMATHVESDLDRAGSLIISASRRQSGARNTRAAGGRRSTRS
jgi:8-amino-7-oxononanoate synthase